MQVYRYFDIGTAKLSLKDRESVRHHLIDILSPDEEYSAGKFKKDAAKIIKRIHSSGKISIVAGGTGLYINALTKEMPLAVPSEPELREKLRKRFLQEGAMAMHSELLKVDPLAANKINPADKFRIERALEVYYLTGKPISSFHSKSSEKNEYNVLYIVLNLDRGELYRRINERVEEIVKAGLVEEVKGIMAKGYSDQLKPFQSIGYKEIVQYLRQKIPLDKAVENIKKETRHFAKRQLTWFKKVSPVKLINVYYNSPESTDEEIYKAVQERFNIKYVPEKPEPK